MDRLEFGNCSRHTRYAGGLGPVRSSSLKITTNLVQYQCYSKWTELWKQKTTRRRTWKMGTKMSTPLLVLALGICATPICRGAPLPLTNLVAHLRIAQEVRPQPKKGQMDWLIGEWRCVDRVLRKPPTEADDYAFLRSFTIESHDIFASRNFAGGVKLLLRCAFIPDGNGKTRKEHMVEVEHNAKGFCFGSIMMTDVLILKRDPNPIPEWLILEHSDTGDVFFFRRGEADQDHKGKQGAPAENKTKTSMENRL